MSKAPRDQTSSRRAISISKGVYKDSLRQLQHVLEVRYRDHEFLMLGLSAEAHHPSAPARVSSSSTMPRICTTASLRSSRGQHTTLSELSEGGIETSVIEVGGMLSALSARGVEKQIKKLQ